MASPTADHSDYQPGSMEIEEHKATFHGVMGMFKWGSLVTAAALAFLTMLFCTAAGFAPAAVVAVVILVVGVIFLRQKKSPAH